jgi:uncharacterized membrane protein YsdA (DUF1294 family)/cold shock CspA family protein
MNPPSQSPDSRDLIRKALAPKGSATSPPPSKPPTCKPQHSPPPASNSPVLTSKIVEWDQQKGFGYLRHQKGKLFLHHKDFSEHHKRPGKGDRIHYQVGSDHKGRRCAVEARQVNDGGKITLFTWIKLTLLAAIPVLAWSHLMLTQKLPILLLILPLVVINLVTYFTYKGDKANARAKVWRTSEVKLHFLELIGGWPAAFVAQRQFRHKCSKGSFQATYWMIVGLHLFLAIDYVFDWAILKTIIGLIKQLPS